MLFGCFSFKNLVWKCGKFQRVCAKRLRSEASTAGNLMTMVHCRTGNHKYVRSHNWPRWVTLWLTENEKVSQYSLKRQKELIHLFKHVVYICYVWLTKIISNSVDRLCKLFRLSPEIFRLWDRISNFHVWAALQHSLQTQAWM